MNLPTGSQRYILIGLLILLGQAIFAVAVYMLVKPGDKESVDEPPASEASSVVRAVYEKFPTIVVNPSGSRGETFLVVELSFLLRDAAVIAQIEGNRSRINDALLGLFTHKGMDELTGPEQEHLLKSQIAMLINQQLPNGGVVEVVIRKMIVQ